MMHVYDIFALVLIGISHVLLYVQLIRYTRFSYTMVIVLSVVFLVLLGIIVTVTGYPELNIVMLLLFLVGLGLLKEDLTFMQNVYFSLISIVGITYAKMILLELGMTLFMASPFNLYIWTGSMVHLIISIIILLTVLFFRKSMAKFAQFIVDSSLYYVSYLLLLAGLFIGFVLNYPTSYLLGVLHEQYGQVSYIVAIILFLILLLIVLIGSHLAKEKLVEEQQERLDRELLDYVEKLERTHDELASFRHDYMNILSALDEGVRNKDFQQIESVYNDVIAPTSKVMNNRELDIIKLSRVTIPEVKSVLSVKVIEAQQQGLHVMVDIPEPIKEIALPVVDFIRVISILLDNATEEAIHSAEKGLQLAFFEVDESQYFIVHNSCQDEKIDLQQIYHKAYSSKEQNRGYGLFSLKRMIDKNAHTTLETTFNPPYFTQTFILKKQ